MLHALGTWLSGNWYWALVFVVMAAIVYLLLHLQVMLRDRTATQIERLLQSSPELCAERLENNSRLRIVFRRPVIELWKLDAYMACGDDEKAADTIARLDRMRLEPRDKLELYQKRLSFFAVAGDLEEARKSRDMLKAFLTGMKADSVEPYKSIMSEADMVIGVYVDHDTALIKKLIGRAEHTKNDVMRGISQYRVAKLAYWAGDSELMTTYLSRAEKNLQNTWYGPVIAQAKQDPSILNIK